MAFERATAVTPVGIGSVEVRLYLADPDKENDKSTTEYNLKVKFSNGAQIERSGDLLPYITTTERNQLLAFMNTLKARAVAEILPTA